MSLEEFTFSIENPNPGSGLTIYLKALWYDAKGDWDKAHQLVDHLNDLDSCIIHAYLHRKEGDIRNADYWYWLLFIFLIIFMRVYISVRYLLLYLQSYFLSSISSLASKENRIAQQFLQLPD